VRTERYVRFWAAIDSAPGWRCDLLAFLTDVRCLPPGFLHAENLFTQQPSLMFPAGMSPVTSLIYACNSCTLSSRQLSSCTQYQWPKDYIFGTALIFLIFNVAHKRVWETYSPAAITSASVFRMYRVLDVCGVRCAVCGKCVRIYAPFRDAPAAHSYYGGWPWMIFLVFLIFPLD
jgi:hypothetical protein